MHHTFQVYCLKSTITSMHGVKQKFMTFVLRCGKTLKLLD